MGLKGGEWIRKAEEKLNDVRESVGSGLSKSGNLSNFNLPVAWINRIKNRVWDRVSVWIFHSSFEKWISETNNAESVLQESTSNFYSMGIRLT